MATTRKPNQTQQVSSFEAAYVSLELLPYIKSGKIIPFHILNNSVMPDFLRQLSHGRAHFTQASDGTPASDDPLEIYEKIKEDMAHIRNAGRRLETWEREVNGSINQLVLQCIDDAYPQSIMGIAPDTGIWKQKLLQIEESVSLLKEKIYWPLSFAADRDSESFKRSSNSLERLRDGEVKGDIPEAIGRPIPDTRSVDIREFYNELSVMEKNCLLCFSVFPEDAEIKKKVLAHWWIGEEFVDSNTVSDLFQKFKNNGLIELVYKNRRPSADSCRMSPPVRQALIKLAEDERFAGFSGSPRPHLARGHEPGSSAWEFTSSYASKQKTVQTLFNVGEVLLEFEASWFAKMKNARVLQLGRWESSAKHVVEVESSEFLKGLKRMKHLRYLSLRGVSRITKLPSSVCKLSNLRILNLNGCQDLVSLPEGIGSLKKLTHLDMFECYFISHMPKGIARLSELEILKGFVIGKTRPQLEGKHCQLHDLTKLKKLKKLNIRVDRNMNNAKRELACLEEFKSLKALSISWSPIYYPANGGTTGISRVINRISSLPAECLPVRTKPGVNHLPEKLTKLDLHYFPGQKISEWFSLEKLETLEKFYIRGGNFPSDLSQEKGCWKAVKFVRVKFLKELAMEWADLRKLFPNMTYLEMSECPKLCTGKNPEIIQPAILDSRYFSAM